MRQGGLNAITGKLCHVGTTTQCEDGMPSSTGTTGATGATGATWTRDIQKYSHLIRNAMLCSHIRTEAAGPKSERGRDLLTAESQTAGVASPAEPRC